MSGELRFLGPVENRDESSTFIAFGVSELRRRGLIYKSKPLREVMPFGGKTRAAVVRARSRRSLG